MSTVDFTSSTAQRGSRAGPDYLIVHYLLQEPPQPPACFTGEPQGLVTVTLLPHPVPSHFPVPAQSPAQSPSQLPEPLQSSSQLPLLAQVPLQSRSQLPAHSPSQSPSHAPFPLQSPVQSSHGDAGAAVESEDTAAAVYVALDDVSGMTSSGVLVAATMPVPNTNTGTSMARAMVSFLFLVMYSSRKVDMSKKVPD